MLVLAPKRSAVQRGVIQEFVGARTSWWSVHAGDETSSAGKVGLAHTALLTTIPLT